VALLIGRSMLGLGFELVDGFLFCYGRERQREQDNDGKEFWHL
jgi:hypothetical protein